jgi:hypothetical protein
MCSALYVFTNNLPLSELMLMMMIINKTRRIKKRATCITQKHKQNQATALHQSLFMMHFSITIFFSRFHVSELRMENCKKVKKKNRNRIPMEK